MPDALTVARLTAAVEVLDGGKVAAVGPRQGMPFEHRERSRLAVSRAKAGWSPDDLYRSPLMVSIGRRCGRELLRLPHGFLEGRQARDQPPVPERRAGVPLRPARPGLVAGRALHRADRRGAALRHRDDQGDGIQHGPQARQGRAGALVLLGDKLGLLVWQDMPSGFATGKAPKGTKADHENFRRELEAVMDAFRFHPSIVAWIPYNEGWGQPDAEGTNATLQWTKKQDPSRLIGAASGWTDHGWGDWKDMHSTRVRGCIR